MYNDAWWQQYREWADETEDAHEQIIAQVNHILEEDHIEVGTLIDLGCGRLGMGYGIGDPVIYFGVDSSNFPHALLGINYVCNSVELQDFLEGNATPSSPEFDEDSDGYFLSDNIEETILHAMITNTSRWHGYNCDAVVVSLFALELYGSDPDAVYREAFECGARAVISAGVHYRGTDVDTANDEPGSTIRQTDPCPPAPNDQWTETRIVRSVPSVMFGPDVVEVWRIMIAKEQED